MKAKFKWAPAPIILLLCGVLGYVSIVHAKRDSKSNTVTGVVIKVSDGDTLWLRPQSCGPVSECKLLKVRMQGIDAPESCQAWGDRATEALRAKLLNQAVEVDTATRDVYGRELAKVRFEGEDVGAWMVLQGHAWSYRYQRSAGPYAEEERQARREHRGLFADPSHTEPRLFRKAHGPCNRN